MREPDGRGSRSREKRPRQIGLLESNSTRWPASPSAVMASRDDRLEPSLRRIFGFCVVMRGRFSGRTLGELGARTKRLALAPDS